jgi:pyruvate/2-oxoglutarate dehydrogenase complex dihydrolipoamide acyltransferase (E2) component
VIEKILAPEGATVAVGERLATIDPSGEAQAPAGRSAAASTPAKAAAEPARPAAQTGSRSAPAAEGAPRATPLARRVAEQEGLDLRAIEASGPSGRVTRADVLRERGKGAPGGAARPAPVASKPAARAARGAAAPAGPAGPAPSRPAYLEYQLQPGDRVIPMTPLRRLVAEHMVVSKRVSPHVGTVAEIDLAGVARVRDAHKESFRATHGFPLSFLPFVVHACVRALREYPALNASVLEDAIVEKQDIHIGIAVETEKGLVVPVVRFADRLSLAGLAEAVEDLARRARSKRLSPDELKGGTFTISNPGREGNLYGFAIINQPQVGILRMGEVVKRAVVRTLGGEDAIVIRPIMYLALSYDHRAVDGAPANGFLHRVRELLEEAEFDL